VRMDEPQDSLPTFVLRKKKSGGAKISRSRNGQRSITCGSRKYESNPLDLFSTPNRTAFMISTGSSERAHSLRNPTSTRLIHFLVEGEL
jgi:hypothetical protein